MATKADASRATTDWGTPDPRDKDAYPSPATTSMTQLGREFLRRLPDYRNRWGQKVQPFLTKEGGWDGRAIDRHHDAILREAVQHRRGVKWVAPWEALHEEFRVTGSLANGALDPRLAAPPTFDGELV